VRCDWCVRSARAFASSNQAPLRLQPPLHCSPDPTTSRPAPSSILHPPPPPPPPARSRLVSERRVFLLWDARSRVVTFIIGCALPPLPPLSQSRHPRSLTEDYNDKDFIHGFLSYPWLQILSDIIERKPAASSPAHAHAHAHARGAFKLRRRYVATDSSSLHHHITIIILIVAPSLTRKVILFLCDKFKILHAASASASASASPSWSSCSVSLSISPASPSISPRQREREREREWNGMG